ncbi:uncharacterized protein V6R79_025262 [Siganus canaliculatus]
MYPQRNDSSSCSTVVFIQNRLHPAICICLPSTVCTISVGTVSASYLCPALSWHENQVCPEEALQRLFLCSSEGPFVCVLQDKSQTQAEAGINIAAVFEEIALFL